MTFLFKKLKFKLESFITKQKYFKTENSLAYKND